MPRGSLLLLRCPRTWLTISLQVCISQEPHKPQDYMGGKTEGDRHQSLSSKQRFNTEHIKGILPLKLSNTDASFGVELLGPCWGSSPWCQSADQWGIYKGKLGPSLWNYQCCITSGPHQKLHHHWCRGTLVFGQKSCIKKNISTTEFSPLHQQCSDISSSDVGLVLVFLQIILTPTAPSC